MFGSGNGQRPTGVKIAQEGPVGQGKPNTIVAVDEAKFYTVHLFDERGRPTSMVVMEAAGVLYTPPNTMEWAKALRAAPKWVVDGMKKQIEAKKPVAVPDSDQVDVMGTDP
jgi:hypothetical protein